MDLGLDEAIGPKLLLGCRGTDLLGHGLMLQQGDLYDIAC